MPPTEKGSTCKQLIPIRIDAPNFFGGKGLFPSRIVLVKSFHHLPGLASHDFDQKFLG